MLAVGRRRNHLFPFRIVPREPRKVVEGLFIELFIYLIAAVRMKGINGNDSSKRKLLKKKKKRRSVADESKEPFQKINCLNKLNEKYRFFRTHYYYYYHHRC